MAPSSVKVPISYSPRGRFLMISLGSVMKRSLAHIRAKRTRKLWLLKDLHGCRSNRRTRGSRSPSPKKRRQQRDPRGDSPARVDQSSDVERAPEAASEAVAEAHGQLRRPDVGLQRATTLEIGVDVGVAELGLGE